MERNSQKRNIIGIKGRLTDDRFWRSAKTPESHASMAREKSEDTYQELSEMRRSDLCFARRDAGMLQLQICLAVCWDELQDSEEQMIITGRERFSQRKRRDTERGGLYAWCPREKRLLSKDEVRNMVLPPGREVCIYCGMFVDKHIDANIFG